MSRVAAKQAPPQTLPKSIERVFVVRHLSANGPEAYGWALFGSRRVSFVDVEVRWDDGTLTPYRMLMILDASAVWNVYPFPDVSPLLSAGLNEETASTVEFERGASKP